MKNIANVLILSFLFSFFLTVLIAKYSIPYLRKFKLGQNIRDDGPKSHLSKAGTPTMGGIFFVLSIVITNLIFRNFSKQILAIFIGMIGFSSIGFLDDFFKLIMKRSLGLNEKQKLIIQFFISIVLIVYLEKVLKLNLMIQKIPFLQQDINFGYFIYPILVFVMLAVSNATNLTDGLDGLSSSVSIPVFLSLGVINLFKHPQISIF